jgi:N utilization substance protein B
MTIGRARFTSSNMVRLPHQSPDQRHRVKLQPIAPEWPIEQIARVDRAILRLGLYELLYRNDKVPPKVAINEAVELAKAFGSDNSSKFVNGVLGTAYRTLVEGQNEHGGTA